MMIPLVKCLYCGERNVVNLVVNVMINQDVMINPLKRISSAICVARCVYCYL